MMFGKNLGAAETAKRIPVGSVGVEIGVWRGDSTALFLDKAAHVHCVDPWSVAPYEPGSEHGTFQQYLERYAKVVGSRNPEDFQKFYDRMYREVCDRFPAELVTMHRCTSGEFFKRFCWKVDWVYVDGSHQYGDCKADLLGALNILKPGGRIYGDDYRSKPGVTRAVDEFSKETGFVLKAHGCNQYEIRCAA